MASSIIPVEPFDLVIFGGSGDLAKRKILPALYNRMIAGQMPEGSRIIGAARSDLDDAGYRKLAEAALKDAGADKPDHIKAFLKCLHYQKVDAKGEAGWTPLAKLLNKDPRSVRAFYLSVGPSLFDDISERLSSNSLCTPDCRIVVEKPFGHDLETAQALNASLSKSFTEKQIYRIDHYLGKETVQNLMALRFANMMFEPLWNSQHIDHVQITVAESLSVAGRGGYYDKSGAMRDMVQNHLMQLLCLTAMEPPARFDPDAVRDEKLKVIRALDPVEPNDLVRGQYRAGGDKESYVAHSENPDSKTESFIALKTSISNWRWAGTPFYLRTGKRLRARVSEIAVKFKMPRHTIFPEMENVRGNALLIRLQPDEGITMRVSIKEPGPGGMRLTEVPLDMSFAETVGEDAFPDAYERLIMDVIRGNQTLFMRGDELEAAWAWTDPIIARWKADGDKPHFYDAGSSGPEDALMLMHRDGRRWREIES